jgi:Tfp pilus assembly protein PilP
MNRKRTYPTVAVFVWGLFLLPWAAGQQTPAKKTAAPAPPPIATAPIAPYRGARYEPTNRTDPFLNPLTRRKNENPDEEAPKPTPPPGIAGMNVQEVELVGVSKSREGYTAVFRGPDKRVYFLHIGDHLFDGYLKDIGADSVQMIRETKLKSGKVSIQEITKRLRT